MAEVHYFTDNRNLPSNRKEHSFRFSGKSFTFVTDEGVFSKSEVDYGSEVLLKSAIQEPLKGNALDLGCGYGVIGIILKAFHPQLTVTCSDVNPRAVELTKVNSTNNESNLTALVSDRFEAISDTFDVILTNPPIRAGKEIIYGMFDGAYAHLNEGGVLLVVIRRKQGAESAVKKIKSVFGNCEVIARDKGYWILKSTRSC